MKILLLIFLPALLALNQAAAFPDNEEPVEETDLNALPEAERLNWTHAAGVADVPEDLDGLLRSGPCDHSWFEYGGRCFRFFGTPSSWAKAQRNCVSMQANLASVGDFDEYIFLQDLIYSLNQDFTETWIGGSDAQEEGIWLWSDGNPFNYVHWCSGEPSNWKGKQHCVKMNYGESKCWDDTECRTNHAYVCTRKISSCP